VNIITKPKAKVTLEDIMSEIKTIKSDIKRIDARLTRVIQLNNLKE
jgi:predicted RNA-binding protein